MLNQWFSDNISAYILLFYKEGVSKLKGLLLKVTDYNCNI